MPVASPAPDVVPVGACPSVLVAVASPVLWAGTTAVLEDLAGAAVLDEANWVA